MTIGVAGGGLAEPHHYLCNRAERFWVSGGACLPGHGGEALRVGKQGVQGGEQAFGGEIALRQEICGTDADDGFGVAGLMVVGGLGEGDEEGGAARGAEFGDGAGTGAAEDEVGFGDGLDGIGEGGDGDAMRVDSGGDVGLLGGGGVAFAGLMEDGEVRDRFE